MITRGFWRGKKVLVTGHTGFKGGWLTMWLVDMGAQVTGYALPPDTGRSFFTLCGLADRAYSILGDVRDQDSLTNAIHVSDPQVIFHLAAQPLVRRAYHD